MVPLRIPPTASSRYPLRTAFAGFIRPQPLLNVAFVLVNLACSSLNFIAHACVGVKFITIFLCAIPLDVLKALTLTVLGTKIHLLTLRAPSRGWHLALWEAATGAVVKHSIGLGILTLFHSGQALTSEFAPARSVIKIFATRILVAISLLLALAGTSLFVQNLSTSCRAPEGALVRSFGRFSVGRLDSSGESAVRFVECSDVRSLCVVSTHGRF